MSAASQGTQPAQSLWRLHYEQTCGAGSLIVEDNIVSFDRFTPDLAFNDTVLESVQRAWQVVAGPDVDNDSYMKFEDREGVQEDDTFDS